LVRLSIAFDLSAREHADFKAALFEVFALEGFLKVAES
jgi:hypothetical protein